jgi:hypothetical protein
MAYYRIYLLDSASGIGSGTVLECANDDAAVAYARARTAECRLLAEVGEVPDACHE